MNDRLFAFTGTDNGRWQVTAMRRIIGASLPEVQTIDVIGGAAAMTSASWQLHGVTSNERYVETEEKRQLVATQQGLGRENATFAALIPIRKNAEWWLLSQQERRDILEAQSHHIRIGMRYLPAIARRLYHCRDLALPTSTAMGERFDFLTWFEFAPADAARFDDLLAELRATPEWSYVDRECEIRLIRSK